MSTGDIRLNSNGAYWQAVWTDRAGRRVVRSIGSKAKVSQAAAERECRKLGAKHIVAPASASGVKAPKLADWEAQFFGVVGDRIKDGTKALYRGTFERLRMSFGDDCRLNRIDPASAAEFASWLGKQQDARTDEAKTIGPDTVARHIRECRRIWGQAIELGLVTENPWRTVRLRGGSTAVWEYVTPDQYGALVASAPDWEVLLCLCRHAALRRGEAFRLTWADVDMTGRTLRILPEADEDGRRVAGTKQGYRTVPMSPVLHAVLARYGPTVGLVVRDIYAPNVGRDFGVILRRAGLKEYGKPLHTLRKSCISDWLAMGCAVSDVAIWAGHSIDVLMRHYAAVIQTSAAKVTGQQDSEVVKLRARIAELELAESAKKEEQQ
jgi:integrase